MSASAIGKISYNIDGEVYSTELIAKDSVQASNLEIWIFRILLIFLILYILTIILKKINRPKQNKYMKTNKRSKRKKIHKGGRYKFNQIQDYM